MITKQTLQLILDYHHYHGDHFVSCVKTLKTPRGGELYLVRFTNEKGEKFSSVDVIWHDSHGEPYATEMFSEIRAKESDLIRFALEDEED